MSISDPQSTEQNIAHAVVDALDGLGDWWERGGFNAQQHPADDSGRVVLVYHYPDADDAPKGRAAYTVTVARAESYDED